MAEKRMFSNTIIDSDVFLDMPQSAQNLYFHLNMRADDEGFINSPKKIMRMIGSAQNDLEILLSKRYLLAFDTGVIVIKHWKLHNTIRKDRLKPTVYLEEKSQISEKDNGIYTDRQPNDNQVTTRCQHRLDKIRLDKYSSISPKGDNTNSSESFPLNAEDSIETLSLQKQRDEINKIIVTLQDGGAEQNEIDHWIDKLQNIEDQIYTA